MRNFVFSCAIGAVVASVVALVLLIDRLDPGYDDCAAKGGVAVRTTTSWVCAQLEVIK